jgi:hypothetical protein
MAYGNNARLKISIGEISLSSVLGLFAGAEAPPIGARTQQPGRRNARTP